MPHTWRRSLGSVALPRVMMPSFVPADCVHQPWERVSVLAKNGALLLTADHGNLERMREDDGIKPYTAHTTNPVPLLWISEDKAPLGADPSLGLASIAPSLLMKMGLDIPEPMRATPLIFEKNQ